MLLSTARLSFADHPEPVSDFVELSRTAERYVEAHVEAWLLDANFWLLASGFCKLRDVRLS